MSGKRRLLGQHLAAFCVFTALLGSGVHSYAQVETREYPPRDYYLALAVYQDGDFASAYKAFQSAGKGGIRSTEGRWVDSICYHAMMGECLYQMGQLPQALDEYTQALNLLVAHQTWMIRVDFPPVIEPSQVSRKQPNWAITTRRSVVGRFPDRYPILQGRPDNERVLVQGGIISLPEYILINAHEIARCSSVAIRRRREIMGTACRYDPLTTQVLQALSTRPTRQNHWSQSWIDIQLGMAAAAAGKQQQAISDIGKGLLTGGQFDHPLTAIGLLELGKLAYEQEQYGTAGKFFLEASLTAAHFQQFDHLAEALRMGALTHIVSGQQGIYAPLQAATAWSRRESRFMEATLLVAAAENSASINDTQSAVTLAEQARRRMVRTEMQAGAVGARLSYVTALVNYQVGKLKAGDTAFASLMNYQRKSSQKLFEIGLVDGLYTKGVVTDRVANTLYSDVLREPGPKEWMLDPVETLSLLLTPHLAPLEHWFEAALKRREFEQALEIGDRIRRHRFYTTLPMGGRLMALRWVLESPKDALDEGIVLQRQTLLEQFPRYSELSQRAAAVKMQLNELPLKPEDDDALAEQSRWLNELSAVSLAQELQLREMALRRAPSTLVFPPPLDFKKAQASLNEGQLVLAFLSTSRAVHAFAFGQKTYSNWTIESPANVQKDIASLLRGLGQLDKNQPVDSELLLSEEWRETARELLDKVSNNTRADIWDTFDELVIVPDGPLWYVPFEALQVATEEGTTSLISKVRVRYVPTVALANPDGRTTSPIAETGIVAGKLYPRDDSDLSESATAELREILPRTAILQEPLKAPGNCMATLCDRLIVLRDIDESSRGVYDWSPLQLDRAKPGGSLGDWMALPWGCPEQIVLPGFHTPAESSLRRGGTGNELFLSACGMMASGARTILLSRWRTGGQSAYDLVREFAQELPYTTAADAWQRSVQLTTDGELMIESEPRVRASRGLEKGFAADHPFFWSGYLLIDTGASPAPKADTVVDAK